ncbi:ATP-binding protein [Hahella aquimaris]|uniref:ATP-binding protein n=1 Tax=Hahella sp. HNIBRBA332 TaxID=3015983 RepID=UPI00273B1ACE|nr:ATP-binding protein [Hahella sp. HNIBRBA332]WLQ11550.1 ATP-binding protein [Hahella sp. HNIBRBA332]
MNNVFLRVYSGVALSLLVYAVIALGLFHSINAVRYLQYREQRVAPLFNWVIEQPEERLEFLKSITTADLTFDLLAPAEFEFSRLERERLAYGQTIVLSNNAGIHAFAQAGPDKMLGAYFADLPLESALWAARLISLQTRAVAKESREDTLLELGRAFNLSASLAPLSVIAEWPANIQGRFLKEGWTSLPSQGRKGDALAVSFDKQFILQIDPVPTFNPWAWPVLTTLIVAGLVCIGATLYLLLEKLERRLRKLETVASRIARGELDARVDDNRFDAVGRLGTVFNRMAEHIQRLVAVQREMIHAVSHELRTPVARIRFGVQMIEDSTEDQFLHKQLSGIDSDIQELNELIDEILTYARLEQGGPILDFQEANVKDIVNQVVGEQSSVKPNLEISAEFVRGSDRWKVSEVEPRYIHRSVQNLVGNATRYAKSKVVVHCNFGQETCRIDVEDDGPGIPESDWERVFTAFARLDDSRTRSSGGYGLGLSIVRRILYWHGGQAFVGRSENLGGAKFSLVWPRKQGA